MASIAGVPFDPSHADSLRGCAFRLDKPSAIVFTYVKGGMTAMVRKDAPGLVVMIADLLEDDVASVHDRAFAFAQTALDVMSMRHGYFHGLPSGDLDFTVWFQSVGGPVVRVVDTIPLGMHMTVEWSVKRADGSEETSNDAPLPEWQESFRYLRYSQLTDNIYDAYRLAYLAVEALFSQYYPRVVTPRREGDKVWSLRACRELERLGLDFATFVDGPVKDAADDFVQEQYVANRCAQDHAKLGEDHYLPGILDDRPAIQQSTYQLGRFIGAALRQLSGNGPAGGTTTFAGIKHMSDVLQDLELFVSADDTEAKAEDTEASPRGLPVDKLATTYMGNESGNDYDYVWRGAIATKDLTDSLVRSIGSRVDNGEVLFSRGTILEMQVDGFVELQSDQVHYWKGNGGIRRHYRY